MKKDFMEILYDNRKKVIIIFIVLLVGILLMSLINKKEPNTIVTENPTISLNLFGREEIQLSLGEEYQEPGYYAVDSNGVIRTNEVIVNNNINVNKSGNYTITYRIDNIVKTRLVKVLEKESKDGYLTLKLIGDSVVNLVLGEKYQEMGYEAISKSGEDLTSKVKVTGEVNTDSPGTYTLVYYIADQGETKQVIRTIIVQDDSLEISIIPNKTTYTNTYVTLNIKVIGNNFSSLTLPNQVVTENSLTTYNADKNGTYNFIAYNKNGKVFTKSITINNIDNTKPNVSCTATINENDITTITVNASDLESGIKNYQYYDASRLLTNTTVNRYTYATKVSNLVSVKVYDKAGNYTQNNCTVIDNSEPDRSGNKVILIGDSRTVDMCHYSHACKGDEYVAKSGMGYSWFIQTGIPNTNSILKKNPNTSYNIFILLGVNDNGGTESSGQQRAIKYLDAVKEQLQSNWKNQYVYYVSINPVINSKGKDTANKAFNNTMKQEIEKSGIKNLKYCDTASKLTITSKNSSDGVHYNAETYKQIRSLLNECYKR